MNDSEPPNHKVSKMDRRHQNQWEVAPLGTVWGNPVYCPDDDRHRGGMTGIRARVWNVGSCGANAKGESQGDELTRLRVPMWRRGADRPIVVMKPGNAGGAKGASKLAEDMEQPAMGGIHG